MGYEGRLENRWGVLFQQGALFSSLTVSQNVAVPMREYLDLPQSLLDALVCLKIELVGLMADSRETRAALLRLSPGLGWGKMRLPLGADRDQEVTAW